MRKVTVSILVLVLLCSIAACGGGGGQTSNQPAGNQSSGNQITVNEPTGGDQLGSQSSGSQPAVTPPVTEDAQSGPKYGGLVRWAGAGDTSIQIGLPHYLPSAQVGLQPPWAETLLLEATDAAIYPHLAKSWEIRQDESKVIFTLRDDITFSDGTKLNAEAVKWNVDFFIETKLMNPAITGANVLDEYVVEITLAGYSNAVLPIFASHSFVMTSKEFFDKNGDEFCRDNPVGTGAFTVAEQIKGIKVIYERNPTYWMKGKPYLDNLEYIEMRDVMTQNAAVMSSNPLERVDHIVTGNGEQIQTLLANADVSINSFVTGHMSMFPSSRDPESPLSKLEVRQAMAYAIDRESICEARGFGIWQPAKALIPPPYSGHKGDQNFFSYDPDKSRELLADAGYPNGFAVTMHSPTAVDRDMVVALQDMLGRVGIAVDLNFPEAGAATDLRVNGWDGIYMGGFTSLPSISSTYRLYVDPGYQFYPTMWRPFSEYKEWEDLYESARLTILPEQANYEKMHEAMLDYMVVIPIYRTYSNYIVNNRVQDSGWGDWGVGTIFKPWDIWVND